MAAMEPDLVGAPGPHSWAGFNPMPQSVERRFPGPRPAGPVLTPVPQSGGWHYKGILITAAETVEGVHLQVELEACWCPEETAHLLGVTMSEILTSWCR